MALDPNALLEHLTSHIAGAIVQSNAERGEATISVDPADWSDVHRYCKDTAELDMNYFRDLTVVDYIEEHPRFEVVTHLFSLPQRHALRVKTRVPEDAPTVPTITGVYPAANWFEREAWDMYGVTFEGHPDLRRLLMYEGFEGHALRKDYPVLKAWPLVDPLPTPPSRPAHVQDLVQIQRQFPGPAPGSPGP